MKKLLLFLTIALCFTDRVISQDLRDLIVTGFGDSVRCTISSIKGRSINFLVRSGSDIKTLSYPLEQVKSYKYYFYQPQELKIKAEEKPAADMQERRILFSLGGGYDTILPGLMKEYLKYTGTIIRSLKQD